MDFKKRARAGIIWGAAGIAVNAALAAVKIAFGFLTGMVSLAADGFNNFGDCASGAASVVSFKISVKPPDSKHPAGHRRAEYVASMATGLLVLFVAWELLRESAVKIISGEYTVPPQSVFIIAGISAALKAAMAVFYGIAAKKLKSGALAAASVDSACDCIASLAVTCGACAARFGNFPADGWAGVAVALLIAVQGIFIFKTAGSELLGEAPDPKLVESVKSALSSGKNVLGIHDLRIYCFGKDLYVATVHVEMPASLSPQEAHAEIDRLEHVVSGEYGISLTAHFDPVDLSDGEALELERRAKEAVAGIAEGLELHDFRLIRGIKNKLAFDAGIPFSCPYSDAETKEKITGAVRAACGVEPVVTLERE